MAKGRNRNSLVPGAARRDAYNKRLHTSGAPLAPLGPYMVSQTAPAANAAALSITDLRKTYDTGVQALKGVSLQVAPGDFFALLGPNGAGKSTLIGIVSSLVNKSAGEVEVFGVNLTQDRDGAMRLLGLVPQELNFNMFEKPLDILVNYAGFYGLPRAEALVRAEEELKRAQLWDKATSMSRTLSGGMKRRLMIARAMMTRPRLLILDEPTAGVDIEIRRGMWKTLKDINTAGTTIILTTHYLEEAESLCRNVAIIDRGTIVEQGPMRALLAKLDVEGFVFDIDGVLPAQLPAIEGTTLIASDDHTLDLDMPRAMDLNRVFAALGEAGIRVRSMRTKSNRLEELFVRLTGDEAAAKREQAA
jgi:ABC-2 type transport system ATP-binding protein